MKRVFKRVTALMLVLALTLSFCCVAGFAADVDYAHFEVGTATVDGGEMTTGATVRIPLSIVGMKEGQYCGGFNINITLGDGLEWFDSNNECVQFTDLMSSFGSKFINHNTGLFTGVDFGASSSGSSSCNQDGKICDILCRVTDAYDGSNATIAMTNVSISGTTSTYFLNSTDNTKKNVDSGAILFQGVKVNEGAVIDVFADPDPDPDPDPAPEYTIVAEADKTQVVAGDEVTVTVTVKGGEYVGAAVKLSYDSGKLELKTPASGWDSIGTGYGYFMVNNNGGSYAEDTVIGTFVFTALAQSEEATTTVALSDSFVAGTFDEGWSEDPANEVSNTDATITINQQTLDVTVPTMDAITYDGQEHSFEAVTSDVGGVTITYSEEQDGAYTADIPAKKDAGEYTLYYKAEKMGYGAASGSYTMTISPRPVTITVPAQGKNYGAADPELTYTVENLVDGETFNATISREAGEDVGDYDITVAVAEGANPNYNVTSNEGGTFTISANTIEGYTVTWNDSLTYNGQENPVADLTTADGATEGVTVTWTLNGTETDGIPAIKDAGTYTVTYTISKENYESITETKTITVAKAAVTITADDKEMTYGGRIPELTYTTTGAIYEGDDLGIQLSTTADGSSTPSDYDITVTYTDNTNYEVTAVDGTLTIKAGAIEGYTIAASSDAEYDEQAHVSATVTTGTPADAVITYTWTEGGEEKTATEVPSFTEPGTYEVSYTISKENYESVTGSYTFTITSGVVEASAADVTVTYDGQPHSITVTVTKPEGSTITYRTSEEAEWSGENPTFTNVSETPATVYWKVSKVGYADLTGSATVTINPKPVTITPAALSKTYGEADPALTGTVTGLVNDNDLGAITYTREAGENVKDGGYTITASYTENSNYDVTASTGVFTINPKAVTITVNSKEIALGDSLPTFDGTVEGVLDGDDLNVTYACDAFKQEVGTYDITASYTGNANYTVDVINGTLTVSVPTYEVEYIEEYVSGYHMILVHTGNAASFSYDGKAMYDVSSAGYQYKNTGEKYARVYAIVVEGAADDTEETVKAKVAVNLNTAATVLDCDTLDVNSSDSVDLRDAVAVMAVYNANETYMTSHLDIVLKADVNHSKNVDAADFSMIKTEYMK